MSPAPTARARPSPSCAPVSKPAGYRVHAYTSPHLVRFHERIRLAGKLIDEATLVRLCSRNASAPTQGQPITFFEITTAAAFLAFAREPADILLLEVGLGGRFDATNVIPRPAVTVITPVSLDHQHFLGDTVAAIAFEKAGILKPGVPGGGGGASRTRPGAVIEARARELGAPLYREGKEWTVSRKPRGRPRLSGQARARSAAARALGRASIRQCRDGAGRARLPRRLHARRRRRWRAA